MQSYYVQNIVSERALKGSASISFDLEYSLVVYKIVGVLYGDFFK